MRDYRYTARAYFGLGLLFLIVGAMLAVTSVLIVVTRSVDAGTLIGLILGIAWTALGGLYLRWSRGRLVLDHEGLRFTGRSDWTVPLADLASVAIEPGGRLTFVTTQQAAVGEVARGLRRLDPFAFQGSRRHTPRATVHLSAQDARAIAHQADRLGLRGGPEPG